MGDKSKCAKKKRVVAAPMLKEVAVNFAAVCAFENESVASMIRKLIHEFMEEREKDGPNWH
tara:strand:+ start:1833 stop:2015 length:183 start_codon:yes stop_codon:yes gene_type:complete